MKKYPSKYSNGKSVSAAQYITEIICEKFAKMNNKDLHYRFWTNPEWSKFYRDQIASANKLLSKYSDTAIVKALSNKKAEKIYSLRAPYLPAIVEYEQNLLDKQNQTLSIDLERKSDITFSKNISKPSIISKLKDLE